MLEGILMKHGVSRMQRLFDDPVAGRASVDRARRALPPAGTTEGADATLNLLGALDQYLAKGPPSNQRRHGRRSGRAGMAAAHHREDRASPASAAARRARSTSPSRRACSGG